MDNAYLLKDDTRCKNITVGGITSDNIASMTQRITSYSIYNALIKPVSYALHNLYYNKYIQTGARSSRLDSKITRNYSSNITLALYTLAQLTLPVQTTTDINKSIFQRYNCIITRYDNNMANLAKDAQENARNTDEFLKYLHTTDAFPDLATNNLDYASTSVKERVLTHTNIYYITQGFTLISRIINKLNFDNGLLFKKCPEYERILQKYLPTASFLIYQNTVNGVLYIYTNSFDDMAITDADGNYTFSNENDLYGALTLIEMLHSKRVLTNKTEYTNLKTHVQSFLDNPTVVTTQTQVAYAQYLITRIVEAVLAHPANTVSVAHSTEIANALKQASQLIEALIVLTEMEHVNAAYDDATIKRTKTAVESKINTLESELLSYYRNVQQTEIKLTETRDRLYALTHKDLNTDANLLSLIQSNPMLKIINTVKNPNGLTGDISLRMTLQIVSPIQIYDKNSLKSMIDSARNHPDRYNVFSEEYRPFMQSIDEDSVFTKLTFEDYLQILKIIFIDRKYSIITDMRINLVFYRTGDTGVKIEDPIQRNDELITDYIPQPHVTYHWCWSDANAKARASLEDRRPEEAIAYILGTAQQWNVGDYTVTTKFIRDLFKKRRHLHSVIDNENMQTRITMEQVITRYLTEKYNSTEDSENA